MPSDTAAQRVEALRGMAESSASIYVGLIESEGAKVDPHRAFVDGFMTAIELLLTAGSSSSRVSIDSTRGEESHFGHA